MHLSLGVTIILLLIQSIFGTHVNEDNDRVVIGSSIGGMIGLIIFILDIIAIFELLKTNRGMCWKLIWILIIIFFPFLGLIFYCWCARPSTVDEIV